MATDPQGDGELAIASRPEAQQTDATLLQTFLAGRDTDCPRCRYNLRDLSGSRCPECGNDLVLRVGLVAPHQKVAIAGLIVLSAGTGLNGLLLGYYGISFMTPRGGADSTFVWLNLVGLMTQGLALAAWLRFWRAICRRSRRAATWLIIGCCLLVLANLIVFSLLVD
jgi:uncharacterized membrane protein YidH (DUF202 family)